MAPHDSVHIESEPLPVSLDPARQGIAASVGAAAAILRGPLGLTTAVWCTSFLDGATGQSLAPVLAITPRTVQGLVGVVGSPLVHISLSHLLNNTYPLLVAGSLVAASGPGKFRDVTVLSVLTSGLGVWANESGTAIGASGLAYGYIGYSMARGLFDRRPQQLALSAISALLFLGTLPGLLPGPPGVSWLAHLFGFSGGLVAAALLPREP
ncbi:MAG: rhomboid family intramembrane serine protease [Candidatus Eremiobacterota bacterium]